jgi:hypothetical protein
MQIVLEHYLLNCRQWGDKGQMKRFLSSFRHSYYILDEAFEQQQEFYSVRIQSTEHPGTILLVGICSGGIGLLPSILVLAKPKTLFVGYNSRITIFDIDDAKSVFEYELDSLFYSFTLLPAEDKILVQHETGMVMLTKEGVVIWKFLGDIITNLQIDNGFVLLDFMDAPSVSLVLESGKPV